MRIANFYDNLSLRSSDFACQGRKAAVRLFQTVPQELVQTALSIFAQGRTSLLMRR